MVGHVRPSFARTRRDVLGAVGAAGLTAAAGCAALSAELSVSVPEAAPVDEPVPIVVEGVGGAARVDVRATARSRDGVEWASRATFEPGDSRTVNTAEAAPVAGTYDGADASGPFWSMVPAGTDPGGPFPPRVLFRPPAAGYDVTVAAETADGRTASATTTRRLYDPAIERRPLGDGLVGELYAPPGDGTAPGVVHLHGAGGRPHVGTARLLASRGIATLALRYFGDPDPIPDTLTEVPLAYVERAVERLRADERVDGSRVGLVGFSRGGELALLAASRLGAVDAVAGWVPSGVVWEGLRRGRTPAGTSGWAVDGEPVPYLALADVDPGPPPAPSLPFFSRALENASDDALRAASVPVEDADAPVHLVSATDDRRWPSTALCERVVARLDAAGYPRPYRHDRYDGAGHYLRLPTLPTAGTARDRFRAYGGDRVANARASAGAWSGTLRFLREHLGA